MRTFLKILSILTISSAILLLAFGKPAPTSSYFGFQECGGTWHDAKKTVSNTDDDFMCWAAAASNILSWTWWGYPTGWPLQNADDIFLYFQYHWQDVPGGPDAAYKWWFNGTYNDTWLVEIPGGNFWPDYNALDYIHFTGGPFERPNLMSAIDNYLHLGYGVTLTIGFPGETSGTLLQYLGLRV